MESEVTFVINDSSSKDEKRAREYHQLHSPLAAKWKMEIERTYQGRLNYGMCPKIGKNAETLTAT